VTSMQSYLRTGFAGAAMLAGALLAPTSALLI
jgi:hypothetical protein